MCPTFLKKLEFLNLLQIMQPYSHWYHWEKSITSVIGIWKFLSLVFFLRTCFLSGILLIYSYFTGTVLMLIAGLFPRYKLEWDDMKFMVCQKC